MSAPIELHSFPPLVGGLGEAIIGIDIGGTKMLGGLLSLKGEVLSHFEIPTRPHYLLDDMISLIRRVLEGTQQVVKMVGVGSKGLIDRKNGILVASPGLGVRGIRIAETVKVETGLSVFVDNDVHAATIGEIYFGAGQAHEDFILYNAGTGIAAGFVFNGRLHRGASNNAGEVGHMSIDQCAATTSAQGLHGCVEGLMHDLRRGVKTPPVTLPNVCLPSNVGYGYIAVNIIQLLNALNPSAVVLAGGMFNNSPADCEWVRQAVLSHSLPPAVDALEFFGISRTKPFTGLVGAAALVLEATNQEIGRNAK